MLRYADHHIFTSDDLKEIKKYFEKIQSASKIILTTEKDGVRLEKFRNELKDHPIYVLPIKHSFLFGEGPAFDEKINSFVKDILW
jgi:tetraacyldisaccharide 4'-kinase